MMSKSPQRNTFQKEKFLERSAKDGRTPDNDPDVKAMEEYYDSWNIKAAEREKDPDWQKNNLEWDLRTTDWILAKVRERKAYAQNLYSALCNNDFQKLDVIPILKDQTWSCSWRYAGGIVADMRQEGDYIDWYCSGIRGGHDIGGGPDEPPQGYVPEGQITDEVKEDLKKLGWRVMPGGDWENFE